MAAKRKGALSSAVGRTFDSSVPSGGAPKSTLAKSVDQAVAGARVRSSDTTRNGRGMPGSLSAGALGGVRAGWLTHPSDGSARAGMVYKPVTAANGERYHVYQGTDGRQQRIRVGPRKSPGAPSVSAGGSSAQASGLSKPRKPRTGGFASSG